jgi:hypothetical protein
MKRRYCALRINSNNPVASTCERGRPEQAGRNVLGGSLKPLKGDSFRGESCVRLILGIFTRSPDRKL